MKNIIFLLVLCFSIDLIDSKNKTHLDKVHGKKNNTHRTFLIRTGLNKTELEELFNKNQSLVLNGTTVSEIEDDNETFSEELDIEIEDEIDDNRIIPHLVDFFDKENNISEAQSLLAINNRNFEKKGKIGIILPFLNLIFFIYVLIYLNKWKNNKKSVRVYKLFDLSSKEQNLIIKNE